MDNSQHTPGPWRATWHNGGRFLSIRSGEFVGVARVNTTNTDRDANALLIAAAPDLLEALQLLVQWDERGMVLTDALVHKARIAIAAATGSTHE